MWSCNFYFPKQAAALWREELLPRWPDRHREKGKRFLGSLGLDQAEGDAILAIVRENLRKQGDSLQFQTLRLTYNDRDCHWLNIVMVAFTEYAYRGARTGEGFWRGLCEEFDVPTSQVPALKQLVTEGIKQLKLITVDGGYKFVSQLWLQGGIPRQNLPHFAELMQALALKYGWWELSQATEETLSRTLLAQWQELGHTTGTLHHFLEVCCETDHGAPVAPVSGMVAKGLAYLARELEHQKLAPEALLDRRQRQEILKGNYLPEGFFLREWEQFITLLRPSASTRSRGARLRSFGKRPLVLWMDPEEYTVQLILPEQELWQPEWRTWAGTYCKIPQLHWEGLLPTDGTLTLPEKAAVLRRPAPEWSCQLLNHYGNALVEWRIEGLGSPLPVLAFDAMTGEHLPLSADRLLLESTDEIFLLTPGEAELGWHGEIDRIETALPTQLLGWKCRQLRLLDDQAELRVRMDGLELTVHWQRQEAPSIQLSGLKVRGGKRVYAEAPAIWLPPSPVPSRLQVTIESVERHAFVANTTVAWPASGDWTYHSMAEWLPADGTYLLHAWNDTFSESVRFELRMGMLSEAPSPVPLTISARSQGGPLEGPLKFTQPETFWTEVFQWEGLWPLEALEISWSDGHRPVPVTEVVRADGQGRAQLECGRFMDRVDAAEWLGVSWRRMGEQPRPLAELGTPRLAISARWTDEALDLDGLSRERIYDVRIWNLLLPNQTERSIPVPRSPDGVASVALDWPAGVYRAELVCGQNVVKDLGWWAGPNWKDLPDEVEDEAAENFCYAVLGGEAISQLPAFAKAMGFEPDPLRVNDWIQSLEQGPCHLPAAIRPEVLVARLKGLLPVARVQAPVEDRFAKPISTVKPPDPGIKPLKNVQHAAGEWHLIHLNQALNVKEETRRARQQQVVMTLEAVLKAKGLMHLVVSLEAPVHLPEYLCVKTTNFSAVMAHLEVAGVRQVDPRAMRQREVNKMLGVDCA